MRYLLLTDIHANLEGLDTCLKDARARGYDETLVLGDIVGYGPDPNAVIQTIRALNPRAIVRGNHDKVALGMNQAEGFHAAARAAAHWMLESLTHENREWLVALPMGPILIDGEIEICHGAPFDEDHYIFDGTDAQMAFAAAEHALCLFGHTHLPAVFRLVGGTMYGGAPDGGEETRVPLQRSARYLINVGSIGQPRDGDSRAAYGVLDDEAREVTLFRVPYAVDKAQARILAAGLPASLANRLAFGR
jgi:diadenosine tetraphosphatase ApaH/serine/threonine PP2A family protein phosphatase